MGFVLLLLLISYIIIHRDAKSIKQYKRKTTDLIGQLEQSVQRNEALIASRKKAVHTITHELRTPLTAITGYTELLQKECSKENNVNFLQSIQQSSDRMRDMLNTLLDFFRLEARDGMPFHHIHAAGKGSPIQPAFSVSEMTSLAQNPIRTALRRKVLSKSRSMAWAAPTNTSISALRHTPWKQRRLSSLPSPVFGER